MKKALEIILITCAGLFIFQGCGEYYTKEQVNATVGAKMDEILKVQHENVTVETVIVRQIIEVTPTVSVTPSEITPTIILNTETPSVFNRFTADEIYTAFKSTGINILRTYYELNSDQTNHISDLSSSATKFTYVENSLEYQGRLFIFNTENKYQDAFNALKTYVSDNEFSDHKLFTHKNVIVELEGTFPQETADELQKVLDTL